MFKKLFSRKSGIDYLKTMQKLDVKDGDIIVIKNPYKLSAETYTNLRLAIQKILKEYGYNVKVMILEDGMDIGVLRKEDNYI